MINIIIQFIRINTFSLIGVCIGSYGAVIGERIPFLLSVGLIVSMEHYFSDILSSQYSKKIKHIYKQ